MMTEEETAPLAAAGSAAAAPPAAEAFSAPAQNPFPDLELGEDGGVPDAADGDPLDPGPAAGPQGALDEVCHKEGEFPVVLEWGPGGRQYAINRGCGVFAKAPEIGVPGASWRMGFREDEEDAAKRRAFLAAYVPPPRLVEDPGDEPQPALPASIWASDLFTKALHLEVVRAVLW